MNTRGLVVLDLLRNDKKYLTQAEELLAEYKVLLEGKPLGKNVEIFYVNKFHFFYYLSNHGEKYQSAFDTFKEEMREIFNTREHELETAHFYAYCGPADPFITPEGQAAHRAWIERIAQRIAVTEDAHVRFMFYQVKGDVFYNLILNDAITDEEYHAHFEELEAQTGKDEAHADYMNVIYHSYCVLLYRESQRLLDNDIITNEALKHFFASAKRLLYTGETPRGHNGLALGWYFPMVGYTLFARCTPEQRAFFIKSFTELLEETEKIEKEWIAAGKPMERESELPLLRGFLNQVQLIGQEISLIGTTLDGKPFDLESLRGKVVLLDFWALFRRDNIRDIYDAGIRKMRETEELYKEFHVRGFEVVGINIDMEAGKKNIERFVQLRQLPWIQLHDPKRELFNQLHGMDVPYSLLLDRDGKVILQDARGEALKRKLDELF